MLISVESKLAIYHHVVVVWREMVVDYESMYTYPLTEDTLRQICNYYLSTNYLWVWHLTFNNLQSITGKSEYSGLGHSRILQTREFYWDFFLWTQQGEKIFQGWEISQYVSSTSIIYDCILLLKYCPQFLCGKVQNDLFAFSP
jgi:hypothetical protein